MEIAIVGGGIVGLVTALSLEAAGLRATVYESVEEVKPLGVGINLLPHAVRELTELGLLDRVRRIGVEIDGLTYRMADGREVWNEPRGLAAGYGWPQIAIHRGRFHLFLLSETLRRLGPGALRVGYRLERFDDRGDHVVLHFRGRSETVRADVVIGADGIHSAARRQLYPGEGRPAWNGVSLFRSTTRLSGGSFGSRMLWVGHAAQKFIAYPLLRDDDNVLLNWVCDLRTGEPGSVPHEDWNRMVEPEMLISSYRSWRWDGLDIPALVAAGSDVFEFPMVDRDPLPRWSFNRVTLAGDAAHAMYPIGSNGATQGIIDARALAFHLATAPDPVTALGRYDEARREPTGRIVLENRAGGPDRVLELARERASDPTVDLDAVLPPAERAEIAARYKQLAGFDPASLALRPSWSVPR